MAAPASAPATHLQTTLKEFYNREVIQWFSDLNFLNLDLSNPRESLAFACLHNTNDSLQMTMTRQLLFADIKAREWPNSWPLTVPPLLTEDSDEPESLSNVAQAFAWLARNLDAISGQYPIKLEVEDTDPLQGGDQTISINLPNQAEAMAELFGLAYEANTNSELAVNMLFRMVPEIIAAKNSSLSTQDYTQAITNWLGFRTKNVQRKIDSNFNPLKADSLQSFLSESQYYIQGVADDDPHTLVEWIQQIKYATAVVKASVFRGAGEESNLQAEMQSVVDSQPPDSAEAWEKFIDALNRAESNLTDTTVSPRPRATSVDNVLDTGTILPDRDGAD